MSEVDVRERREVWIGHQSAAAETHDGSEGPRNGEPAEAAKHIALRSRVGSTRDGLCVERRNDSEVATVSERVTEAYSLPCRRVPGVSALGSHRYSHHPRLTVALVAEDARETGSDRAAGEEDASVRFHGGVGTSGVASDGSERRRRLQELPELARTADGGRRSTAGECSVSFEQGV